MNKKEVSKALFWAEYVPESGAANKVYNTADLRAVGYNTASFDLTNDALMAASDAFCGKLETIANASVTLKRAVCQCERKTEESGSSCGS